MDKSSLYSVIATHPSGWNMGFHAHMPGRKAVLSPWKRPVKNGEYKCYEKDRPVFLSRAVFFLYAETSGDFF